MKDWKGNKKTTFVTLGANPTGHERELNDFYATDPNTLRILLDKLEEDGVRLYPFVWEPACGMGHLSEVLKEYNFNVTSSDIVHRGYHDTIVRDFLKVDIRGQMYTEIITNPPFKYAEEFVRKALDIIVDGHHVVFLLKIQFMEGQKRKELFKKFPPKYIYVNSTRQTCYINGDMSEKLSSASCYCWFIWEKGFKGEPTVRWI